jgi:uncharacterized protein
MPRHPLRYISSLRASGAAGCRVLLGVALALWLVSAAAGAAQTTRGLVQEPEKASAKPGAYYALVIGIDDYPSLPHLETAVRDAQAVGALLESSYGFKGHVTYLLNRDATRAHIMDDLEGPTGYAQTLGENDNLLIYYAGHGYYNQRTDKAYWLPYDAESAYSANHVSADDLTTAIRGLAAHHVLIISDSCYSGDLTRGVDDSISAPGERAFLQRMLAAPSRSILSSGGNEPVADTGPGGHSIFAAALLRALAEQPEPLFTAADLADPVKKMVRAHSSQVPEYFRIGNSMPRNFSIDVGDFVFARSAPAPVEKPSATASTSASDEPAAAAAPDSPQEEFNRAQALFDQDKYSQAAALYGKACDDGAAHACAYLAWMEEKAECVPKDVTLAAGHYRDACAKGDADACTNLGVHYFEGNGVQKDTVEAAVFYQKGCDGGDPYGCTDLGIAYAEGLGVAKDPVKTVVLYGKGCDGGDPHGCTNLGLEYDQGIGVAKDPAQALAFYRKACDGRYADGCAYLGSEYDRGIAVAKDPAQAAALYHKACDWGDGRACSVLGIDFEMGTGVAKDALQAATLYGKGCDASSATGCMKLGHMYEAGEGLAQDKHLAIKYYRKACDLGDQEGCDAVQMLDR